jgi:hypothetical protein
VIAVVTIEVEAVVVVVIKEGGVAEAEEVVMEVHIYLCIYIHI